MDTGGETAGYALSEFEKFAIDATIKRQISLLDLMKHTDTRAQQLIAVYTGLAGAAGALATSGWMKEASEPTKLLLVGYATFLVLGVVFAFQACRTVDLKLPSRSGDYWVWVGGKKGRAQDFLTAADASSRESERLQDAAANWLCSAMVAGQSAVLLAFLTVLISIFKLR
jgi:hypothetical protein